MALGLSMALVVNSKIRAQTFFRAAFYFPSVTSSIAVAFIFIFLFSPTGLVNGVLSALLPGNAQTVWLDDADGVIHIVIGWLGIHGPPHALAANTALGLSWWEWMSGPSVALCSVMTLAIWTTVGTFMLMFLAGLQSIPEELDEASMLDGATGRQRFFAITLPLLRPTVFLVLTLGLIGTWQVFDQVYAMTSGGPQKTTLTPAFLVYREGFENSAMGRAAAVAFILFVLIVALTALQRLVLRKKD
jgi:multiple sugar transport system permease protein